ncbi:hypothetical protein L3X38_016220 [Prunus dulcis]|uniref:Uncharacterized protein n=1 Tax=Prunus dulcis TaxID=3755 RepID=A0AAD4Z8X7_PRUDU|nr:hypothetical protein L3X38_016220 [Prunus dulcis]
MRKHGWQLPYHPLQVVAVAVFLALAFAFYAFFAPFVGNKDFSVHCDGPLRSSSADPADPGVFRSKKYLKIPANEKHTRRKDSKLSTSSM